MKSPSIPFVLLSAILTVGACGRSGEPRSPATPASNTDADPVSERRSPAEVETANAAARITGARCEREQRCRNIGGNRKYSTLAECDIRVREDWSEDLNAVDCPGGVDQTELSECMSAIRAEDCNSPFDTLGRITACTTGQICQG